MANVSGLIEQLQAVVAELQTLVEEETSVEENSQRIEELEAEARDLQSKIERAERYVANLASLKASIPRAASAPVEPRPENREITVPAKSFAIPKGGSSLRAFRGDDAEEMAYRSGMWIKGYLLGDADARRWCSDYGVRACNLPAQAGRTDGVDTHNPSLGGALVPDEMADTIIRLVSEYGAFAKYASRQKMNSDVLVLPRRVKGLTAKPVNENCEPDPETMQFNQVKMVAGMWAVQNRLPNSLLEDSVINLADLIALEAGYGFSVAFDEAGFKGDGTAAFNYTKGVLTEIAKNAGSIHVASKASKFSQLTMADFTALVAMLPDYAMPRAAWYISPSGFGQSMVPLAMAAGGNAVADIGGGPDRGQFLGFPVRTVTAMPAGAGDLLDGIGVLFGDFEQACTYGDRRAITIKTSSERFMEFDQLLTYASARCAMSAHELGSGTAAGSLVGLKFASAAVP